MLIAAMVAASVPARAAFYDGNSLLSLCHSESRVDQSICLGYVGGIADAWRSFGIAGNQADCLRSGVSLGQVQDVVIKSLEDNPGSRDKTASSLALKALSLAFCK
jgi:hypothetical protein